MKKTQFIELFKNIKRTLVSFLSIVVFVFLGIGLFSGLHFTEKSLTLGIDEAFERSNSYDIVIPFTFGISEEQANSFLTIDGVDEIEASNTVYEHMIVGKNNVSVSIQSVNKKINVLDICEGRLPEQPNEMVVNKGCAESLNLKVGDKVTFNNGNGTTSSVINLISKGDEIDLLEYKPENLNNLVNEEMTITGIAYHPLYLSNSKSAYGTNVMDLSQIEGIFYVNNDAFNPYVTLGTFNTLSIKSNSLKNLSVQEEEFNKKLDELTEKIKPLAESISNANKEKFFNNYNSLMDNATKIVDIIDAINDSGIEIDERLKEVATYKELLAELGNSLEKLDSVYYQKRSANIMISFSKIITDIINKLKYVLGGVFLLISFAICYSLINRLVHDDRKLIGTKKALGFTKGEIYFNYLGYIFLAVLLGTALSTSITIPIENGLLSSVSLAYNYRMHYSFFSPIILLILFAITLIVTNIFAILGCSNVLKEPAKDLLQGEKAPSTKKRFYQKGKLWNKLGLLNKTIINNTVNDKRRVLATIIGISASVCLITGSITLRDNIEKAFTTQFEEHFKFDSFVFFDNDVSPNGSELKSYFDEKGINSTTIYRQGFTYRIDDNPESYGFIIVYDKPDEFEKLCSIKPGLESDNYEKCGTWLPESYVKGYDCKKGSELELSAVSGENGKTKITGYYKYYEYVCLIFMDSTTYKETFGREVQPNAYLIDGRDRKASDLLADLSKINGFTSYLNYKSYLEQDIVVFDSLSLILCGLYIVVDVFMSIFVILELLLTFIKEKKKELITMMINGYSKKDACKYIYCDTIFLTLLSLIIGCVIGSLLGDALVRSFESQYMYLLHGISFIGCAIGASITIVLVGIMSIISLKKVKNFKLTDINK